MLKKYELTPIYASVKSFYRKAIVEENEQQIILYSYDTKVCTIDKIKHNATIINAYSATTLRHIKEFLKQSGYKAETKSQMLKDYK